MLLLSMERRMGGAVFSSAWLISEYCVFWQLCFLVQSAHSRDLVNEHQRQTGEDPGLRCTQYSLSVPLKKACPHSSSLKPSCDMVILQRQRKHTRNMQQVLLTSKNKCLTQLCFFLELCVLTGDTDTKELTLTRVIEKYTGILKTVPFIWQLSVDQPVPSCCLLL